MFEKLPEALLNAITGKSTGYAAVLGLVVAAIATSVTIFMLSGVPDFARHPPLANGQWFLSEFFFIFILIGLVAILMAGREEAAKKREADVAVREAAIAQREAAIGMREADDLLSGFRDALAGIWEVAFLSFRYNDDGEPLDEKHISHAILKVNQKTKKLAIEICVKEDGIFEDQKVKIEALSIWPVEDPKFLDYYHDLRLVRRGGIVSGPVFVHLSIDFDDDKNPVSLTGTWYDLDGAFAKAQKDNVHPSDGHTLDELPIRGRISFKKLDRTTTAERQAAPRTVLTTV